MDNDLVKKLYEEIQKRKMYEQEEDMDLDDDDNEDDDTDMDYEDNGATSDDFCEMISKLFHSQIQTHVFQSY